MLDIILIIVAVIAAAIIALLIYAATRPSRFRVQRSITINAPAESIFPQVNDLRAQQSWSPWEAKDPAMKRTYGGAQSGKGAKYEWQGNKQVGHGRMEIVESTPPTRLLMKLDFIAPFPANNMAEFILEPRGDSTVVTWAIFGPSPYMSKLMGIFMSFDKMIGKEFDTGLAKLKALMENQAPAG
ncbi:MAG: SRPBCC family protein [Reyranellaceae bacterium]